MFSISVFYVGFVAVLNLALGYALAVYLGQAQPLPVGLSLSGARRLAKVRPKPAPRSEHPPEEEQRKYAQLVQDELPPDPELEAITKPAVARATSAVLGEAFDQWLVEDPGRVRTLCTALVDVDQLEEIRENYGELMVDQLLKVLTEMVQEVAHEQGSVTQLGKHRFLMTYPDTRPPDAVTAVEHLRQTIEHTVFRRGDVEFQATLSCAVVEVLGDDSRESLLERVECTLEEAQQYGRNRTFLHEGEYPTPVMPPELTVEDRVLPL